MSVRLLYLVRHGEYIHGSEPELGVLTDLGRQQARRLAERLRGTKFTAIHHSPWERAAQTAEILAEPHRGVPLEPSELLQECIPAVPDAQHLSAQQAEFLGEFPEEVLTDGAAQASKAISRFAGPALGGKELLVTHGNLINWFVSRALDAPDHAWLRMLDYNCALTVIAYWPDRTRLLAYNDVGHLPAHMRGTDYPAEVRI
ncbi:phosphoglycerate mutase [Virgisporangium aliadipatigenens]|uniref:Phosphoglycerate mutase n=1 Tax=Virgisporangium aliadipatigenens TaxID=741659 RepID=A0A8J4DUY6_9ACTN|nr:histidine phosphatase family protein [Virgisporangium aliadipatigenens]GIJ51279.1 phosphoglycerate mutase [Virgisporangium aliadipatigenens]